MERGPTPEQIEEWRKSKPPLTPEQLQNLKCGFCGKPREEGKKFVSGLTPGFGICEACTAYAWEIVSGIDVTSG